MAVMMIRARVKPESAKEVETAAKTMFAAIERAKPQGVSYASTRLSDGVTFVILLGLDQPAENPLGRIGEFRAFQENLKGWLAEPSTPEPLTVVGSYNLF